MKRRMIWIFLAGALVGIVLSGLYKLLFCSRRGKWQGEAVLTILMCMEMMGSSE